jgi:hypothetical protein
VDERDDLTLELARKAVTAVSPDELPLIDAVGPELLQAADSGKGSDGSLGFGVAEIAMSTAAMLASRVVVDFLVMEVAKGVIVDEASGWLRRAARSIGGRREAAEPAKVDPPVLEREQVAHARSLAYARAIAVGVDEARAALLADAIAGSFQVAG